MGRFLSHLPNLEVLLLGGAIINDFPFMFSTAGTLHRLRPSPNILYHIVLSSLDCLCVSLSALSVWMLIDSSSSFSESGPAKQVKLVEITSLEHQQDALREFFPNAVFVTLNDPFSVFRICYPHTIPPGEEEEEGKQVLTHHQFSPLSLVDLSLPHTARSRQVQLSEVALDALRRALPEATFATCKSRL